MSDISIISAILVVVVAFFAGLEGILDQFQFHQPIVACTLIGLVTGNLEAGVMLGGSLQMIALGWANIGAAVAPDAALASVAAAIIMIKGGNFTTEGIAVATATAIPLAVAGLFLTMIVRTISVGLVHTADAAAKEGNIAAVERAHYFALVLQGLRIAIPAAFLIAIPASAVQDALKLMPDWLNGGMAVGGAMVVAVGYALVINMMATREVWPFFAIGFALAAISQLTLIALGWANIGAAVAPDAALASVAAAIIMIKGGNFTTEGIAVATATAIPLAVAGLFLTMIVRTISVGLVHTADAAAKEGNIAAVERAHFIALLLQGLRIAIPAAFLIAIPASAVQDALKLMPDWLNGGMAVGGAMVVAVGYAMVINMMATREVWPFFAIGFAFAAISQLTLIALGVVGVALAFIYLNLSKQGGNGGGGAATSNDPIGDILEDY